MKESILKGFSEAYKVDKLKNDALDLSRISGVYAIILNTNINRLLGEDEERILYLGQTGKKNGLRKRITHFFNCASNGKKK